MNKLIFKVLGTITLSVTVGNIFALSCPLTEMIKTTHFIEGRSWYPTDEGLFWVLNSDSFSFDNAKWNVWLGVILPVPEEDHYKAIKEGEIVFAQMPLIGNPPLHIHDNQIVCEYTPPQNDDRIVTAVSPPHSMPSLSLKRSESPLAALRIRLSNAVVYE